MGIFGNKLFGSDLFNFKKKSNPGLMYDFAQHGLFNENMGWNGIVDEIPASMAEGITKKSKKKDRPVAQITPKGIYALKCLNDNNFKIITDKKYLEEQIAGIKVNRRRDPILLAQSPFGFFWQILGAWDEEMIYLGDL